MHKETTIWQSQYFATKPAIPGVLDCSFSMLLLRSKIVPATQDAFWQPLPERWLSLSPARLLVITSPYQPESIEATTLSKLIQACGITEGVDGHILMFEESSIAWHLLKAHFSPAHVLMFGILPAQLGISALFALNAANRFDGSIFIPTIAPLSFSQDAGTKKLLWESVLKPAFAHR